MPVLKQHTNIPAMREAIVLDLGDIGAQAARIRAAAETQAAQIVADAQAKSEAMADQLHEEAQKQGFDEGFAAGHAEGQKKGHAEALAQSAEQLRQVSAAWAEVIQDWEAQRLEMEREARQAVLDFALRAAEKLVHRVIEVDESVVVDQAAQALSLVLSAHDASVRVHPVDRPILDQAMPELIKELARIEHIELVDDEAVTPGGCLVAFGQGQIDARIETQMQRLIDLILPPPPPAPDAPQDSKPDVPPDAPPVASPESSLEPAADPPASPSAAADALGAQAGAAEAAAGGLTAPVYEITEQGLVDAQASGPAQSADAAATPAPDGGPGDPANGPGGAAGGGA